MDIKKLAIRILIVGVALLAAAVVWCGSSFSGDGYSTGDIFTCLYSNTQMCKQHALAYGTSYSPALFWIGVAVTVVGGLLKASLKQKSGNPSGEG